LSAYYNENDPFAAQWLRNLIAAGYIAPGEVDERSIEDVRPDDVRGFKQCHFFAGIGGWSYALRLAGWDDEREVWTGSCPCQPFSSAARGANKRLNCKNNLWPAWESLIYDVRPTTIFGEQVAQARDWLDRVADGMEACDYSFGASFLPALSVGQDHIRERIYFVGHSHCDSKPSVRVDAEAPRLPGDNGQLLSMAEEDGLPARVDILRAYGNAIVPQVAAQFVMAYMELSS